MISIRVVDLIGSRARILMSSFLGPINFVTISVINDIFLPFKNKKGHVVN